MTFLQSVAFGAYVLSFICLVGLVFLGWLTLGERKRQLNKDVSILRAMIERVKLLSIYSAIATYELQRRAQESGWINDDQYEEIMRSIGKYAVNALQQVDPPSFEVPNFELAKAWIDLQWVARTCILLALIEQELFPLREKLGEEVEERRLNRFRGWKAALYRKTGLGNVPKPCSHVDKIAYRDFDRLYDKQVLHILECMSPQAPVGPRILKSHVG